MKTILKCMVSRPPKKSNNHHDKNQVKMVFRPHNKIIKNKAKTNGLKTNLKSATTAMIKTKLKWS